MAVPDSPIMQAQRADNVTTFVRADGTMKIVRGNPFIWMKSVSSAHDEPITWIARKDGAILRAGDNAFYAWIVDLSPCGQYITIQFSSAYSPPHIFKVSDLLIGDDYDA